jgi:hypothetical protein
LRFAVRGPGRRQASPHGMPCRNVACSVHVSVAGVPAGCACKACLALARPCIHMPTLPAALARVRRADLLDPAGRLVFQVRSEHSPALLENRAVQPGLPSDVPARVVQRSPGRASHVADLQVLDADQVVAPGDLRAGLVRPVFQRVGVPGPHPCQRLPGLLPAGGAALSPRQLARKTPGRRELGSLERRAIRQRQRQGDATVDADDLAGTRTRDRRRDDGEGDMPPSGAVAPHPAGPGLRYLAAPAEPDPAGLRDQYFAVAPVQPADVPRPERDDPEPFRAVLLAPRRPAVGAVEEVPHRLIEVPQRLLLHNHAPCGQPRVLRACLAELPAHLGKAGRRPSPRSPPLPLFDSKIPHEPSVRAVPAQCVFLRGRWVQAVPEHKSNLLAKGMGMLAPRRTGFIPGRKAGASSGDFW